MHQNFVMSKILNPNQGDFFKTSGLTFEVESDKESKDKDISVDI